MKVETLTVEEREEFVSATIAAADRFRAVHGHDSSWPVKVLVPDRVALDDPTRARLDEHLVTVEPCPDGPMPPDMMPI